MADEQFVLNKSSSDQYHHHGHAFLFGCGTCFFFTLHYTIRKVLEKIGRDCLNDGTIYKVTCSFVSGIQGIIASVVGAVIASSCVDIMKDVHWLTNTYVYCGFPYFAYDLWAMYAYYTRLNPDKFRTYSLLDRVVTFVANNKLMVAHHLVMPAILFPVIVILRNNRGDFFFGVFYMMEMVVPFISAREILRQLDLKKNKFYLLTSAAMVAMFFLCRLAIFPYLYHAYAVHAGLRLVEVPASIPIRCNLYCLLILLPQIYWFGLMVRGVVRISSKLTGTKSSSLKND